MKTLLILDIDRGELMPRTQCDVEDIFFAFAEGPMPWAKNEVFTMKSIDLGQVQHI